MVARVAAALLAFAAITLKSHVPGPFLVMGVATVVAAAFVALRTRAEWARRLSATVLGMALVFTLLEGAFVLRATFEPKLEQRIALQDGSAWNAPDEALGYAPIPASRIDSRMTLDGRTLYDVTYGIGAHRERITRGDARGESWIFMGCSFAFGEGLNDEQTLPAQFSAQLGYGANVVNLAFSGWGAHQMLRRLEAGEPRALVHAPVRQVIYEAIWQHPQRAAGRVSFDLRGPAYALTPTGVAATGPFRGAIAARALATASRSALLDFVLARTLYRSTLSEEELERYGRIVERAAAIVHEQYATGLTVLYWDEDTEISRRVQARLVKTGLPLILVSGIIPRADWPSVKFPVDGHPTAEADRRLAVGLAQRLAAH